MSDHEQDDDEPLEVFWDDIRVARRRAQPLPDEVAARLQAQIEPGDLIIGTSRERVLAVIKADGRVEFGPEYRPDEAAMVFWEAMGQRRYQYEERILVIQHMEAILTQIGAADLRLEQLRVAAAGGDQEAAQAAGGALVALERRVHQAIELGRGLARRPEIPMPDVPARVPDQIRNNPASDYQGRAGIDDDPTGEGNTGSPR